MQERAGEPQLGWSRRQGSGGLFSSSRTAIGRHRQSQRFFCGISIFHTVPRSMHDKGSQVFVSRRLKSFRTVYVGRVTIDLLLKLIQRDSPFLGHSPCSSDEPSQHETIPGLIFTVCVRKIVGLDSGWKLRHYCVLMTL